MRRHIVGDRHGVQVSGQDDPAAPAEVGTGDHDVARALYVQRGATTKGNLDLVGQGLLVPGHRRHVNQRRRDLHAVSAEIEHDNQRYLSCWPDWATG